MAKIEKFECIESNGNVEKTIMTIVNGNEKQEAEVYLAFIDNTTGKRYLMYAPDNISEAEKITVSLSTLSLQNENYVLEETNSADYINIQLPVINIVGLNNQKDDNEIMQLIDEKFGKNNISIIDLRVLEKNVSNITISDNKPAKKANVPVLIANGIKKFYLARLNRLLKEVYNTPQMTEQRADIVNKNLNKIDAKLDELNNIYDNYDNIASVEKSVEQIQTAKMDIEEAKNRISQMVNSYEIEEPEVSTTFEQHENQDDIQKEMTDKDEEQTTEKEADQLKEDVSETVTSKETSNVDEQISVEDKINSSINLVIQDIKVELANNINDAINKIINSISSVYADEMEKLIIQHTEETKNLTDSLSKITLQLKQTDTKLHEEQENKENLTQVNNNLNIENENLKIKNNELSDTIVSKDEQLNQQNNMIEDFRNKIKNTKESSDTKEQELLGQIEQLKSENAVLATYRQKYERVASLFDEQIINQPIQPIQPIQPVQNNSNKFFTEEEMNEAINHAFNDSEEQSNKTL